MNSPRFFMKSQKGVALFVSLIMLILVTILGVTGVRMVSLEEKMAGNSYDRNLAFQAAEAALREAEKYAEDNKPMPCYGDQPGCISPIAANAPTCTADPFNSAAINNCATGVSGVNTFLCPKPDKDCVSRWESSSGFTDNNWEDAVTDLSLSVNTLAGTAPQYFIEYFGNTFPCTDGGASDPRNCKRYQVTARSNPGAGRATVVLQSVYATN